MSRTPRPSCASGDFAQTTTDRGARQADRWQQPVRPKQEQHPVNPCGRHGSHATPTRIREGSLQGEGWCPRTPGVMALRQHKQTRSVSSGLLQQKGEEGPGHDGSEELTLALTDPHTLYTRRPGLWREAPEARTVQTTSRGPHKTIASREARDATGLRLGSTPAGCSL